MQSLSWSTYICSSTHLACMQVTLKALHILKKCLTHSFNCKAHAYTLRHCELTWPHIRAKFVPDNKAVLFSFDFWWVNDVTNMPTNFEIHKYANLIIAIERTLQIKDIA